MTMKVFLIRHAKTEHPAPGMDDFDRALTQTGKEEAARVSAKLAARGIALDGIISSPAKRAKMTAEIFDAALQSEKGILYIPELYLPQPEVFEAIISQLGTAVKAIAIVSHNNGITDFANSLGIVRIDAMPTSSVLAYEITDKKKLLFFEQ